MRKILLILTAMVLCGTFVACQDKASEDKTPGNQTEETSGTVSDEEAEDSEEAGTEDASGNEGGQETEDSQSSSSGSSSSSGNSGNSGSSGSSSGSSGSSGSASNTPSTISWTSKTSPDKNGDGYITSDEADLRGMAVQYMYDMANIKWTATKEINYASQGMTALKYQAGKTYYGMVYNNNGTGLEKFKTILDSGNKYIGTDVAWKSSPGNSCATSVEHAWEQVSTDVAFDYAVNMMPYYKNTGVVAIGDIDWNLYDGKHTGNSIINNTDKDVIYEAYALTQPGDAFIRYFYTGGHALMITKDTIVVRDGSGKINPNASYVFLTDQNNLINNTREYPSSWTVDNKVSFATALSQSYLPVTITALRDGKTEVPKYEMTGLCTADDLALSTLKGTLTTNYVVMQVDAKITDASGKVVVTGEAYPYTRGFKLEVMAQKLKMWELPAGDYNIEVTVKNGFGTETILDMDYTKKS